MCAVGHNTLVDVIDPYSISIADVKKTGGEEYNTDHNQGSASGGPASTSGFISDINCYDIADVSCDWTKLTSNTP